MNYRTPAVAILVQSVMAALLVIGSAARVQVVQQQANETVLMVMGKIFELVNANEMLTLSKYTIVSVVQSGDSGNRAWI